MNELENEQTRQEMLLRQILDKIGGESPDQNEKVIVFSEQEALALQEVASNYLQGKAAFTLVYRVGKVIMWAAAVYGAYAIFPNLGPPK